MSTKHTALPWHVGMRPGPIIYGPKGEQIADMLEANGEADLFPYIEENRYNAAFIVRACNAHDALVAALQGLADEVRARGLNVKKDYSLMVYEAAARAAIAKATE